MVALFTVDIEKQIVGYQLEFDSLKDDEIEWRYQPPAFVVAFVQFIDTFQRVPSPEEFAKHYIDQNHDALQDHFDQWRDAPTRNWKKRALNNLMQTLRARGSFRYFEWHFRSETKDVLLEGRIAAPREAFVGLAYDNPPGGNKHCLNTKIASCELKIVRKHDGRAVPPEILATQHRAAFEILTDDRRHGIEIRA